MFLFHFNQSGCGRMNQQLPLNVLKRGPITYFSINFNQLKDFYNFSEESTLMIFFMQFIHVLFLMVKLRFKGMLK